MQKDTACAGALGGMCARFLRQPTLWRTTAMRALPRPLSRMGRPFAPWVSTAISVLFPLSTPPATAAQSLY